MTLEGIEMGILMAGMLGMVWYIDKYAPLPAPPPPRPPMSHARYLRQQYWENIGDTIKAVALCAVLGVIGLALVVVGAVSLFSLDEHELLVCLISVACGAIIFGGWRRGGA